MNAVMFSRYGKFLGNIYARVLRFLLTKRTRRFSNRF